MIKWLAGIGLAFLVTIGAGAGFFFTQMRALEVVEITDDLFMLKGMGGNVGVLRTSEGAVIVDTMTSKMQGGRIAKKAQALTGQPVAMIINTHYHLDHTHGNPAFEPGVRVVATDRTLHHLKTLDAKYWQGEAAALLPTETFSDLRQISIGGKTLRLLHPGRGHTDGDLVVVFVEDATIHMGDLFFNKHYPNIDLEAGGTVQGWSAALETALALEFDTIIPGHGELSNRAGARQFQSFMEELAAIGRNAVAQDLTLKETLKSAELTTDAEYEEIAFAGIPLGLNRKFVITRAWEEATGAVVSDH